VLPDADLLTAAADPAASVEGSHDYFPSTSYSNQFAALSSRSPSPPTQITSSSAADVGPAVAGGHVAVDVDCVACENDKVTEHNCLHSDVTIERVDLSGINDRGKEELDGNVMMMCILRCCFQLLLPHFNKWLMQLQASSCWMTPTAKSISMNLICKLQHTCARG
jgi:hypothetical protein